MKLKIFLTLIKKNSFNYSEKLKLYYEKKLIYINLLKTLSKFIHKYIIIKNK